MLKFKKLIYVYTVRANDGEPVFEHSDAKAAQLVLNSLCLDQFERGEEPTYYVTIGTAFIQ